MTEARPNRDEPARPSASELEIPRLGDAVRPCPVPSRVERRVDEINTGLIAYNAGPGLAQRYARGEATLYGETRDYVPKLIAAALLVADFLYFDALRNPAALISLVASFRRGSTLVAFAGGIWLYRESNARQKLPAALGILAGIVLTILG